jgi:precorrin-6B methylase 2
MGSISPGPASLAIAEKFAFKSSETFVDIGSAQGVVPVTLARAHPHLRGIGFDLAAVRPVFEEFVAKNGVSDRVQFKTGTSLKMGCRKPT